MFYVILALMLIVATLLIGLVLIQKGRGGGLIGALGNTDGNSIFGPKTAPIVTWVTSAAFFLFLVLSIVMNVLVNQN